MKQIERNATITLLPFIWWGFLSCLTELIFGNFVIGLFFGLGASLFAEIFNKIKISSE
jgi:hypothetical protein